MKRTERYVKQVYEPKLPFVRTNGMLERCSERWENIPAIQLFTDSNWFGNYFLDTKVGGLFASAQDQPIQADGAHLKTLAAYVKKDLSFLSDESIADDITAEVSAPTVDRVKVSLSLVPKSQQKSIIPFREYNKPETVEFWLSTLGDAVLIENTLGDSRLINSNMGGVTVK